MKKILFASTALVATAGIAAAEVSFSGSASLGLGYDGSDWAPIADATLSVAMSGETDGGLSFGAAFDVTAGAGDVDAAVVYVEGGFGKISGGDVGSAVDAKLGIGDIGFDGLGVDNVAEALIDGADVGNLMYEGTFGDFGVALSYDMDASETVSVAATYAMGDYNIGLGYDDQDSTISVKLGGSFGDFALNALYSNSDDLAEEAFGIHAAYTMGAATVSAAYAEHEGDEAYGLGISYDLGGGASFAAGVADDNGTTVADLGISMSF